MDGQTAAIDWPGGAGVFAAYGTFGSGTAKLQASFDGGTTYFGVNAENTLTADGLGNFRLPTCKLRGDLAGATGPTVDIWIKPLA